MTGSSANNGLADFTAGFLGGAVGKLIDHPFDLIKVRLQVQSSGGSQQFNGAVDCLKQTVRNEGLTGMYKGLVRACYDIRYCSQHNYAQA